MDKNNNSILHILTAVIIILGIITSGTGLFYNTGGKAYNFINQYGDIVKMRGNGLYAHDSYLMASTFHGTDFTILFFVIPIFLISFVIDIKKKTLQSRLFLISLISVFVYYSASIAFGVTYNILHLVYIALFSTSLFGLIFAVGVIDKKQVAESIKKVLPYKGIYIFLLLTGAALIMAWFPDIINSLASGHSLQSIEVYTTQITYVLDMGIVGPAALICLFQLKKRNWLGYILLEILLTLCSIVGIMLPIQTIFEIKDGIVIPPAAAVTKLASFVVMAFFALYFNIRFFRSTK